MEKESKILKCLKTLDFTDADITFYVVTRILKNKVAKYSLLFVETDSALKEKVCSFAKNKIENANTISKYDFVTADNDTDFLELDYEETDYKIIQNLFDSDDKKTLKNIDEFQNTWVYIVLFQIGDDKLYTIRKLPENWDVKKKTQLTNVIFKNHVLATLKSNEPVFKIDSQIDFFAFNGKLLILNKKNFEAAMNFRTGMLKNKSEIIEEFRNENLFSNIDDFETLIGENIHYLRKLSQIKNDNYYKDIKFVEKFSTIIKNNKLTVKIENNKIIAEKETLEQIFHLLDNDYMKSQNDGNRFLVDVKKKI